MGAAGGIATPRRLVKEVISEISEEEDPSRSLEKELEELRLISKEAEKRKTRKEREEEWAELERDAEEDIRDAELAAEFARAMELS